MFLRRQTVPTITRTWRHMGSSQHEVPHSLARVSEVLRSGPASGVVFAQQERCTRKGSYFLLPNARPKFASTIFVHVQFSLRLSTEAERGAWGGCLDADPFTQHTKALYGSRRKKARIDVCQRARIFPTWLRFTTSQSLP